jgi:hypothetical protein
LDEALLSFALVDLFPLERHHVSHATLLLVFDFLIHTRGVVQDVAAYIKKEFDKKHNPTW